MVMIILATGGIVILMIALGIVLSLIGKNRQSNQDHLMATLNILIDGQQRTNQAVMQAVSAMSDASKQQSEVLSKYLDLFKTPGEPQRWTDDIEVTNKEELYKLGFPAEGTEAEQAQWVLDNLEKL